MRTMTMWATAVALGSLLLGASWLHAQDRPPTPELIPHAQDRPPGPALSPAEALAAMTVPEGFTVELVASEPDIVNPVAMTFDEKGRIWITESLEYPRLEPGPGRDRIKILEDTDGDGAADKITIFADGLNIPSGIAVGHGGVWVANSPDILFYPDADRDGVADGPPEVVVTGFGRDDTHELPNSLTWGPDGWLYGWNGVFNPSRVTNRQGQTFDFTCAIFRIHPKTRDFELFCEGTSNPWGIAINEDGELFSSACVIDHLWHLTETGYYIRQGGPYPPHTWPIGSIVDHKHQKAAYCGITYFDSDAYPEEYRGRVYMGNIHGNCINVDVLSKHGSTYRAEPAPDFLSANDAWFMPVVQKTGPDGSLYVLDWYDRYHCYQDANRDPAGVDRLKGRLYRVRYGETPRRFGFDLGSETDEQLLQRLSSANVYDRDIAQRLLTERLLHDGAGREVTRQALESLVLSDSISRSGRLHALWTLVAGGPLDPGFHARLLDHPDANFRAWGIRAAGNMGEVEPGILERLTAMAGDEAPEVRLQVTISGGKLDGLEPLPLLMAALASADDDALIPQIAWQNLHPLLEEQARDFSTLATRQGEDDWPAALKEVLPRAIRRMARSAQADAALAPLLARLITGSHADEATARDVLRALADEVRSGAVDGRTLDMLRSGLADALKDIREQGDEHPLALDAVLLAGSWKDPAALEVAETMARQRGRSGADRLAALGVLIDARHDGAVEVVAELLADDASRAEFRGRVLAAIGGLDHPEVAEIVLDTFPTMEPDLQPRAVELLTARPAWSKALLAAIAEGTVPKEAINVNQLRRLQGSNDPEVVEFVRATWGAIREGRDPRRDLIIGQMRNFLHKTPGDPIAGREAFRKVCAQCHVIHGEGVEVGPDITLNGRNDFEQMLSNVFDPNLVIGPAYQATTVATADGRILTGLLAEDNDARIVLKLQGGEAQVIPRAEVEEMKTAEISLMPEDLESQLTPQEIADLFSFLSLDKPPEDPSARRLPGAPAAAGGD